MNTTPKQFALNSAASRIKILSLTTGINALKHLARGGVLVVAAMLAAPAPVSAQPFNDGFESYPVGSFTSQGGWEDFGGFILPSVSTLQAHSGTKSLRLSEGTGSGNGYGADVWRNFSASPIIGKVLNFSYWQFIEGSVDTIAFMYISTGSMPGTFQTGLDLRAGATSAGNVFGPSMLVVQDIAGNPTLMAAPVAKVTGRWVEYNMTIDLVANTYNLLYDGASIVSGLQWDTTPGDGVTFGGIDFWNQLGNANGINDAVFYDDFRLVEVPEPSALMLAPLGLLLLKLRRRRQPSVDASAQA